MKAIWSTFQVYILAAAAVLLIGCLVWFGGHERGVGAAGIQNKWDKDIATQAHAATTASEAARKTESQQVDDFSSIATGYLKVTSHEYPSIADALPAAVSAGTIRLRNACPPPDRGTVPQATASARAADAAATQALADRVSTAVAAVRTGTAADDRERQLAAQVSALQAVLQAERRPMVVNHDALP